MESLQWAELQVCAPRIAPQMVQALDLSINTRLCMLPPGNITKYALVSKKREDAHGQTQVAGFVLPVTLYFGPSTSSL
jgi:hypothetical protein